MLAFGFAALGAGCGENPSEPHRPGVAFHLAATPRLPLRVGADLVVKRAQFGILENDAHGAENFVPTREVPAEGGQSFGWIVEVDTTRPSLHWQEHLRLPAPPLDWGDAASDPDVLISPDGRSVVAQGDYLVEDGELSRFYWELAPGHPGGEYVLDIAVEGKPIGHFAFRVPTTVREKSILVRRELRGARHARFLKVRAWHGKAGATEWR
jgi:hypothetical protein